MKKKHQWFLSEYTASLNPFADSYLVQNKHGTMHSITILFYPKPEKKLLDPANGLMIFGKSSFHISGIEKFIS